MKDIKKITIFLSMVLLLSQCKTYQPMGSKNSQELSDENQTAIIIRNLSTLEKDEKIQILSKSGREMELRYQSHSSDTLYANYNLPKNKFPTKIAIDEIEELRVKKIDPLGTIIVSGLGITSILIMIGTLYSNMQFGGFSI
ncbi:hypothetical protein [Algoriphagus limi]|uniref:Lipoprotein n=1 Tax=Algoriphagus limi TaxID=2975273 RepID=A0ABT2G5U3_9BACT|nr:hypothetical protein [Algoriphagus limi]MCS5489292.1 hypothetical protein [Algoriphagus limi]